MENSRMRLIVHCGLPKCGSTSIQNSLVRDSSRLRGFQVAYPVDEEEFGNNHHHLSVLVRSVTDASHDEFRVQVIEKIRMAREAGMDTVILSSEDFIYACESDLLAGKFLASLSRIATEADVAVSIALVLRAPRKFLRSYLIQQVANGSNIARATYDRLLVFFAEAVQRYIDSGFPVTILSLEACSAAAGLVPTFYSDVLGVKGFQPEEKHDNTLSGRTFVSELTIGSICALRSVTLNAHVNSPQIDELRESLRRFIDFAAQNPDVGSFLGSLEDYYRRELQGYEEFILKSTPIDTLALWRAALEVPVTTH